MSIQQEFPALFSLPTHTLATLVVGYVGYLIVSIGQIRDLLPIDRVFRVLIFGLAFQLSFEATEHMAMPSLVV